jgi:RHS repeat-associated protein
VNGVDTFVSAEGLTQNFIAAPDPRFGFQAPFDRQYTLATPGGKSLSVTATRSATFADPQNLLSLVHFMETRSQNGRVTTVSFDSATNTFDTVTPLGRHFVEKVNNNGVVVEEQFASFAPINFSYDERGRFVSASSGNGPALRQSTLAYNPQGLPATFTDPLGRDTRASYDLAGRITEISQPGARSVRFGRDARGRVTDLTVPSGSVHRLQFGNNGLVANYTPPNVGNSSTSTIYIYDAQNRPTKIDRPGDIDATFVYDAKDRITERNDGLGTATLTYDATTGSLASIITDVGDRVAISYDGPFVTGLTWSGAIAGSFARTLDNDLRTATESVNGANPIAFTYDNDGRSSAAGALAISRDAASGLPATLTIGSVSEAFAFTSFGELAQDSAQVGGAAVFSLEFIYDKLGRVIQKTETISGITANLFAYAYDLGGRLAEVRKNGIITESYAYDANGNITLRNGIVATYDAQDRLLQRGGAAYVYSAAGDLRSKTEAGQTTQYIYDAMGGLHSVVLPGGATIDYVLDGAGRRTGRKVDGTLVQGFLYKDGVRPIAELDGSGAVVSRFVYAGEGTVPVYMIKGGATYRLFTDLNGSVRLVVDAATGAIVQRLDYDAFGRILNDTSPGFQPFGYGGGLYDPATGLVAFGLRDYDPEAGRWTVKDPLFFVGGDTNLYAYVGNDPVRFYDPNGTRGIGFQLDGPSGYAGLGGGVGGSSASTGGIFLNGPHGPFNFPYDSTFNGYDKDIYGAGVNLLGGQIIFTDAECPGEFADIERTKQIDLVIISVSIGYGGKNGRVSVGIGLGAGLGLGSADGISKTNVRVPSASQSEAAHGHYQK